MAKPRTESKTTTSVTKPISQQKAHHLSIKEMILETLETSVTGRKAVSFQFIKHYLAGKYNVDTDRQLHHIKKSLKSAIDQGQIIQVTGVGASGSFKISAQFKKEGSKTKAVKKMIESKKKPVETADPNKVKKTAKLPLSPVQDNKKVVTKSGTKEKETKVAKKPKAKMATVEDKENAASLKRGKGKLQDSNQDVEQPIVKMKKLADLEQESDDANSSDDGGSKKKVTKKRGGEKIKESEQAKEKPIASKKLKQQAAVDLSESDEAGEGEDKVEEAKQESEIFDETIAEGAEEMFEKLKNDKEAAKNKPTAKARKAAEPQKSSDSENTVGKRTRQGSVIKEEQPVKQKTRKVADSKK